MRIGLISDTHGKLRPEVFPHFEGVELILHAGDIGPLDLLIELETIAPVKAVLGNTDGFDLSPRVPEEQQLQLAGRKVVVTHGHRLGSPTPALLRATYPEADIIIYGHTHRPLIDRAKTLVINPGAAGSARFKLKPSIALLDLGANGANIVRMIEL